MYKLLIGRNDQIPKRERPRLRSKDQGNRISTHQNSDVKIPTYGVRGGVRPRQWGQAGHSDIWAGGPNVRMSGLTPLPRPDPIRDPYVKDAISSECYKLGMETTGRNKHRLLSEKAVNPNRM
jgi:hypothetical protein